jgi:hypothetical protein
MTKASAVLWPTTGQVTPGGKERFFRGPPAATCVPPGKSKQEEVRYLDIHEDDRLDEAQRAAWVKQGSQCPANECEWAVRAFGA